MPTMSYSACTCMYTCILSSKCVHIHVYYLVSVYMYVHVHYLVSVYMYMYVHVYYLVSVGVRQLPSMYQQHQWIIWNKNKIKINCISKIKKCTGEIHTSHVILWAMMRKCYCMEKLRHCVFLKLQQTHLWLPYHIIIYIANIKIIT